MSGRLATRWGCWVCLAGWLAAALPARAAPAKGERDAPLPQVKLITKETPLGTFPEDTVAASLAVDPNSRRVAYAVHTGAAGLPPLLEAVRGSGTMTAIVDRKKQKTYALIDGPFFGPGTGRVAYVAMTFRELARGGGIRASQEEARIVLDGVEGKTYHEIRNRQFPAPRKDGERPVFSPDGSRLAYAARIKKAWRVVVDGREDKTYDDIVKGSLRFSPDSRHYAYAAKGGDEHLLVLDGAEVGVYDEVSVRCLVFSPDSSRLVYGAKRDGKLLLGTVATAARAKAAEVVAPLLSAEVRFSPDGKQLAYIIRSNGGERIVLNGQPVEQYEKVRPPVFGPKGKRFAVIDGDAQPEYDNLYALHFSPNGARVAYVAKQGDRWWAVIDGKPGLVCDGIMATESFFSPDGKRYAYVPQHGKKRTVVIDGVESTRYDDILSNTPIFSPDGKRVAYAAFVGEKVMMVVDRRRSRHHDGISEAVFSPDGKYLAYVARREKHRFVVVRGAETTPCDYFVRGSILTFDTPDRLHTLAARGRKYFRLDIKIAEVGPAPRARQGR